MRNEKYLIIGGDSLVGSYIYKFLKKNKKNVICTSRKKNSKINSIYLDLKKPKKLNIYDSKVFFCASITSIPNCEAYPEKSKLINVKNTLKIIKNLSKNNCKIIYFSSQAVFDGKKKNCVENDELNPTCNYGKFKYSVEKELIKLQNTIIIRPTKILSINDGLLYEWKNLIIKNKEINVFHDLYISPISIEFVVKFVISIEKKGIYHLSGKSKISYFNLVNKILKINNINNHLVKKISYKKSDKKILYKPKYCALSSKYNNLDNIQNLRHFLNDAKFN